MKQSIFYQTDFDLKQKIEILNEAYDKSYNPFEDTYNHNIDLLDLNISFSRMSTNLTYPDVISIFDNTCHFVIIKRYDPIKETYYGEVGFSTMKSIEHYLFIFLELNKMEEIIQKYKLEAYQQIII